MGLDAAAGEPHGTRLSTIVSVIANLVGAGLLSLPFTFKRAGIVPGAVSMCLMAGLNAFSMMIIARCCELSGVFTYKGIGEKALGGVSAKVITAIMALYTLGSCVSFVVLLGDFVPELVCEDGCNTPLQQFFGTRTVTVIIVAIVFLFPLAYQRDLSNLRFSSGLSMLCIVYAALMIGIRAIVGPRADSSELNVRGGGTGIFISFPITTVAMTMHYNVSRFYYELKERSLSKLLFVAFVSFGITLVVYEITALGGYALFGANTTGDVLEDFADDDMAALVARIALSAVIICCYPLAFNSHRASVVALLPASWQKRVEAPDEALLQPYVSVAQANKYNHVLEPERRGPGQKNMDHDDVDVRQSTSSQRLLDDGDGVPAGDGKGAFPSRGCCEGILYNTKYFFADWAHALLTFVLVAFSVFVGLVVPHIEIVLGYKGALGGSLIVYAFPGLMYFSLCQQAARTKLDGARAVARSSIGLELSAARPAITVSDSAPLTSDGKRSIWNLHDLVSTQHGWVCIGFCCWAAAIMVLGTASTAGLF